MYKIVLFLQIGENEKVSLLLCTSITNVDFKSTRRSKEVKIKGDPRIQPQTELSATNQQ